MAGSQNMQNSPVVEVVALALRCRRSGQFLLARRNAGGSGAGEWEFPGGKIEVGETQSEALRREILEELGFPLPPTISFVGENQHNYAQKRVRIFLWLAEVEERPVFTLTDHDLTQWFLPHEMSGINLSAGDKAFISLLNAPVEPR